MMAEHLVHDDETSMPPRRGDDADAVRRYAIACRASALVAAREGCAEAARELVETAARAEQALTDSGPGATVTAA